MRGDREREVRATMDVVWGVVWFCRSKPSLCGETVPVRKVLMVWCGEEKLAQQVPSGELRARGTTMHLGDLRVRWIGLVFRKIYGGEKIAQNFRVVFVYS